MRTQGLPFIARLLELHTGDAAKAARGDGTPESDLEPSPASGRSALRHHFDLQPRALAEPLPERHLAPTSMARFAPPGREATAHRRSCSPRSPARPRLSRVVRCRIVRLATSVPAKRPPLVALSVKNHAGQKSLDEPIDAIMAMAYKLRSRWSS
ncbi:MAG: hypothetical protein JNK82_16175 [Myxococcaceae bacterium]|nr:hypothetical protein [Myxococcaceae bacterium]